MYIKSVEIGNFRKLKAVRIDLSKDKTICVGANNSGKTSATVALRRFLVHQNAFVVNDITLSNWKKLNDDAEIWEAAHFSDQPIPPLDWSDALPFLDIWLKVSSKEIDRVQRLLPTLDWEGGTLGVRLRLEPKDSAEFQQQYLLARKDAKDALASVNPPLSEGEEAAAFETPKVSLWPQRMTDFLERNLRGQFTVNGYLLDHEKLKHPKHGIAEPQILEQDSEPVEAPFAGLIRIDEISAQRGFGQTSNTRGSGDPASASPTPGGVGSRRLSSQLKAYYDGHLDPTRKPRGQDIQALAAIETAQDAFDGRLKECFASALKELEDLGYPGVSDPRLTITTRIKPADGLNHDSAVQYEVASGAGAKLSLPEDSNGLGYQNLVSMVFGLMSFRDAWMKVGKAAESTEPEDAIIPLLHLVLVEEPEAHLHAQVQQVFIKQAYAVLRNHPKLGESEALCTQLVVSTHSSHVAHECEFAALRYFRRMAAQAEAGSVPLSCVENLSDIFGGNGETERFARRYLKATHCDLFFADGAILLEGPAERILVPHLVHERKSYEFLRKCYLTWLEIGGSHAHRLRNLIERLGLPTLIIADLDAKASDSEAAVQPQRGKGQRSRNRTVVGWVPGNADLDTLLDTKPEDKVKDYDGRFCVRVAYQSPKMVIFKSEAPVEALANTFEDALVFENLALFKDLDGTGLIAKFRKAITDAADIGDLGGKMFDALKDGQKAVFALDMLALESTDKLALPHYIHEGLLWLATQLERRQQEVLPSALLIAEEAAA